MQDKERAECYRMLPDSLDWSAGLRRKLGRTSTRAWPRMRGDRSWPVALCTNPISAIDARVHSTCLARLAAAAGETIGPSVAMVLLQWAPADLRPRDQISGPSS